MLPLLTSTHDIPALRTEVPMVLIPLQFYVIYLAEGVLYHLNASVPDGLFSDVVCLFTDTVAS